MQMPTLSFSAKCFSALILGFVFGIVAPAAWVHHLAPVGDMFLHLLKMIVIPITFVMIVSSFTSLENTSKIKILGGKTLFWFLTTAVIASSIGLTMALWLHPAQGFQQTALTGELTNAPSLTQLFLDLVPSNLFDQAARGKVIPIIIFAVLFSISLTICGEEAVVVRQFFQGMTKVIGLVARWIIRLSPIGIFVFMSEVSSQYGFASLLPFAKFILTVALACSLQFVVYSILLMSVARINPVNFVRRAWPMMITAFTTSSSIATLPLTIETLVTQLNVPRQIASFVAPLGANAKMDGCGAIYPAIICIFTASLLHIPLSLTQYFIIILVSALATFGTAGVPSSAVVTAMIVLSSLGLPFNGLMLVLGIDRVLDMIRTLTNVTGTAVCTTVIAAQTREHWVEQEVGATA
jgi:Na+/H+-dicarboxylate symporter